MLLVRMIHILDQIRSSHFYCLIFKSLFVFVLLITLHFVLAQIKLQETEREN